MTDKAYLLNDNQMRDFIVNGYVIVKTDLPRSFHDEIYKTTNTVFEREGNPGNNLLPRIPEIQHVLDNPTVRGALTSLLGADYYIQPIAIRTLTRQKAKDKGCIRMAANAGRIGRAVCWSSTILRIRRKIGAYQHRSGESLLLYP